MRSMIPGYKTFRAIKFLITGPMILGMLFFINVVTSPHRWWVQYAAMGIGIAWVISLMRVIRAVIVVGGLAALAYMASRYFSKQQVIIPTSLV
ncbi:MAG: hypothetical protein ABIR28_05285 [Vicinamibacteria bacterium]